MALARRIGLTLGCVALLVVAAGCLAYRWSARKLGYLPRQMLSQAGPGWMDAFRRTYRLPPLAGLALPRTTEGDGTAAFYAAALTWRPIRAPKGPTTAADSGQWVKVAGDPKLDRVVAAAALRDWDAATQALPHGDSTSFLAFRAPPFASMRIALQGLRVRAEERLAKHDLKGARTDLEALMGLGDQMLRHEITLTGMIAGTQAVRLALPAYLDLARQSGDSAALTQLGAVQAWAAFRPTLGTNPVLYLAAPDSALAMAADSSLALGWRQFMLYAYVAGQLSSPRVVGFGVRPAALDRLTPLTSDPNRDVARLGRVARGTLERFNRDTMRQRWRFALTTESVSPY